MTVASSDRIRVAVAGASGYMGAELLRLLLVHPRVTLTGVTSERLAGEPLARVYPHLRGLTELAFHDLDAAWLAEAADVVFLALPHMESQRAVPVLRAAGRKVIDLSADYRLRDAEDYVTWYKAPHIDPAGLSEAVYGLPELHRDELAGATLVANPGCYPTATLLALAPLARAGVMRDVVVDAKSGVSGAGRAATQTTHFVEADENVTPYGVGRHRHMPEIDQELAALGAPVTTTFTPHLLPLDQGELVSCYVTLDGSPGDLRALYEDAYAGEPFVELADRPPGVRDVRDTNVARIHVHGDARTGKVFVFCAIDNLWKGASSQAVQNLNVMLGLPETLGLQP